MKRLIVTVVLVLVLVLGLVGGFVFRGQYAELYRTNQALVDAAQQDLDEASAAYAAVDPAGAEETARLLERENELMTQAQEEIQRLTEENSGLDASIRTAEQQLEEKQADEDYAYYKAIYDSLAEGKALVESYLEDN